MRSFTTQTAAVAASLFIAVRAIDGIVVPGTIEADTQFNATFLNGNSDQYRVFLAAALAGVNGPTCYLMNSTSLATPVELTIPASVGPSADYYSIAISDVSTSQGATFSNTFNFTGGTGNYTEYEQHLGGAPFWDANDLPCSSYACARQCAQAGYPSDLSDASAHDTMVQCILKCPGVSPSAKNTNPANSNNSTDMATASAAVITLASGNVVTAMETTVTSGGKTMTEAVIGGSKTITLGGAAATVSSEAVSLASNGVQVGSSTTVSFSPTMQTVASSATGGASSTTGASASASSSAAASRQEFAMAGLAGVMGVAALLL